MRTPPVLRTSLACLALATLAPASVAFAQSAPMTGEAADGPLAAVQALFDAMAAHDVAAARKLMAPGTQMLVVRPDGTLHVGDEARFIEALGKDAASWQERSWDARVTVDGPMAQVWAPYDFHLDGKLSHCGTDAVTLAHGTEGWKIIAIAYTMRREGCEAGPVK